MEMEAGGVAFLRTVYIKGTNPSLAKLDTFVASLDDAKGYEKILHHEAKSKCRVSCDHIPRRSWALFRARDVMRGVIESFKAEQAA